MKQTGLGIQPVLWDPGTAAQKTPAPVEKQARETQKPWLPPLSGADNKPSGTTGNKEWGQTDTATGKQTDVTSTNEPEQIKVPGEIRKLLNVFDAKSVIGLGVDGLDYDKLLQMAYDGKIKLTDPGEGQKLTVSWADGWSAKGYKQQPWELAAPKRAKVSASGDDILQTEIHGGQQEYGFVLPKRNTLKDPGYRIVPGSEEQRALVDTYIVGKTGDAEKAGELARFWEEENKQRSFGIYAKYLEDPEYEAYALQGATIQNPDYYHAVGGGGEIGNIVTFSLDNADLIRNRVATVGSETVDNRDGSVLLLYMNGTEVDMYNYLLAKEGSETAQEYLRHIENTLKMRYGQARAQAVQDMKGDNWWENIDYAVHSGALGFVSGVDNAVDGFEQLFSEEKIEPGSLQYANYYFSKDLEGIDKVAYGIANQVGNMTPMILTTAVATALGVPPAVTAALGSATVGLSASGNAYTSALERGCSKEHAKLYAISVGASEAGFQYLLGGIGTFGGIAADDLLVKIAALDNALYRFAGAAAVKGGAEAIEENLQNFIEPLLRTMMLGEEYDLPTWEEIAYTSLVSFFTADLLESGEIAAVTSLGIDAYSGAGADYAALAERVIENAEKTVLGEAQLQSNLERGILEAERRYLAALGEEKLRAMEMPEYELLDALGLSEPEARGAMVLLNLDKFDGTDGFSGLGENSNNVTEAEESPRKTSGLPNGVNWPKIQSVEYNKNFNKVTDNPRVAAALETRAKWALSNRDNSDTEEIYAIDAATGDEIARITDQNIKGGVRRTNSFSVALSKYRDGKGVIILHNHPHSMPPSIADLNALVSSPKAMGVIAGHDGSVFLYSAPKKEIPVREYLIAIRKYREYSEFTAQEKALKDLCQLYGFYFERMVTG